MGHAGPENLLSGELMLNTDMCLLALMHDLTTDGACEAHRSADQKKNRKSNPSCAGVATPSTHPFEKPEVYAACWAQAASRSPEVVSDGWIEHCHHERAETDAARKMCDASSFPLGEDLFAHEVHGLDGSRQAEKLRSADRWRM